jgi:hypothetical protein
MAKQVQIGRDALVFSRVQNLGGCDITPTPTPTAACLTVNLDTQITCNEYVVKNAQAPSSCNKTLDAMVGEDNSVLLCGSAVCGSIINTSNISESILVKSKLTTLTDSENNIKQVFTTDPTFSSNGKINQSFYDSSNFKVPSKFNCILSQVSSGQNRVIVAGDNNNKPLIGRYILSSGDPDRTFGFNTGFVTLGNIANNSIRLINVFGIALQADNRIIVFCNAYDIVNKYSLCVIVRLTNSGLMDTTFNQNKGYIPIRSTLPEFEGNRIVGTRIKRQNNAIYIVCEAFSSAKKNTCIVAKYLLNDAVLDNTFGIENLIYINIDDNNTYYHNLFINQDTLYIIVNSQNLSLHILPHDNQGAIDTTKQPIVINKDIFGIVDQTVADPNGVLEVNFLNIPCEEVVVDNNIIIGVNLNILSNSINTIGPNTNSGFHWFEKQALSKVETQYDSVQYRDCSILPCDRQPQDSYGTLVIDNQKVTKYHTPGRILYGLISISSDMSSVSPIKLDRFDSLAPHNVLKNILKLNNSYVAAGYSGDNFYSLLSLKTLSLVPDETSLGPSKLDAVGFIDFDDACDDPVEEFIVEEECPCAPPPTPTPTPTSVLPTSDIYITDIFGECQGDIPVLSVVWNKNIASLTGSYVLQIVRNTTDRTEILATTFNIASSVNSDRVQLDLSNLNTDLNNRTCIASIIDNAGNVITSKIFVLSISNCQQ